MLCKLLPVRLCVLGTCSVNATERGQQRIQLVIGFHQHLGNLQSQCNYQVFFLPSCGSIDILQRAGLVKFCLNMDYSVMLGL